MSFNAGFKPCCVTALLVSAGAVLACGPASDPPGAANEPLVVASVYPVGDIVLQVGGDAVRVEVLLPPGALPVTWEATPRQLRDVHRAGLFVMVGGGLDEWAVEVARATEVPPALLRLTEGLQLLEEAGATDHEHAHGSGNPHLWLDPILVRDELIPRIEAALIALVPHQEEGVRERARAFSDSLTALDAEIRLALADLENRAFVTTHAAWSYFARRYGLEEAGVVHPRPGHEPGGREIAEILQIATEHEIKCVFTEPQVGEGVARAITTELGLGSCLLDPLGGPALAERNGYLALMRFNTRMFREGLSGGATP
jgi:zinc transport system substrate-binding protein